MKFLITGAAGQLGKEWVYYLQGENISYTAYSSSDLDITNRNQVFRILERDVPDVVVNCAAYTRVDDAEDQKEAAFSVNRDGVKNVADACKNFQATLIHYSTDYVFPGTAADKERYPAGYPENAETAPINVYGQSKRAGELILEECELANWLLIRVAWLCGPYGTNFVKTMLRLAADRDEIGVVDDQFGSPSYTFDVVEKSLLLLKKNETGIFHVTGKGLISWADFAEAIFKKSELRTTVKRITSLQFPQKAKRPFFSYLSTGKLQQKNIDVINWSNGLDVLLARLKRINTENS
jgi:dTDP-4-dehydrorhamnose reductase